MRLKRNTVPRYVTNRPTIPFFAYFMFSIVCASARWQWHGTFWTAAAPLTAFVGLRVYPGHELALNLNHLIILSVYLAVVAALLGYLGVYQERRQNEIFTLAAWPRKVPFEAHGLVRDLLEHARSILHSPRVLMAWDEPEEPWFHLALLSLSEFPWTHESPTRFQPVVAEPLAGNDFFCPDVRTPTPKVFRTSSACLQRWRGAPLHPDLQARFGIESVLSLKLRGETLEGYLFFLDKQNLTSDDVLLGQIVAREVVARLDLFYLIQQLKQMTATESRFRIAHDLHDGLLQSLAVVTTKLETVCHLLDEDPSKVRDRLLEIDRLLHDEQDGMRSFIRELKPAFGGVPVPGREGGLITRLEDLVNRIERQWGLRVDLAIAGLDAQVSETLAHDIYYLLREALLNAARHAAASSVEVKLRVEDHEVRITVADNGHGFSFRGHYDHATLMERKLGPVTPKGRITSLGGALAIDSSEAGARLEITFPLLAPGA